MDKASLPILPFASAKEFETWLEKNYDSPGLWLRFYKKNSGVPSINWVQAVEVALCYGWIDSLVKKFDEKSYIQKFTPRRPKSVWSKINTAHVERLLKLGRMKPAGMKAVESAKADGRWDHAYPSPSSMKVPDDFLTALNKNEKAKTFFETLNKSNKFAIASLLYGAKKPETRERRMQKILAMMEKGEKLY